MCPDHGMWPSGSVMAISGSAPPSACDDARAFGVGAQEAQQSRRVGHGGGEADEAGVRGEAAQAGHAEGQECAALALGDAVQLVENDAAQAPEVGRGVLVAEQQCQRLGRRQQDLRRVGALPLTPVGRRVAGPDREADLEAHLGDRRFEVAGDVGGERLERRDVERVQAAGRLLEELGQARQEAGQGLAAAGGGDQQRVLVAPGGLEHGQLMRARLPAAGGEPVGEGRRQRRQGGGLPVC